MVPKLHALYTSQFPVLTTDIMFLFIVEFVGSERLNAIYLHNLFTITSPCRHQLLTSTLAAIKHTLYVNEFIETTNQPNSS